MSEVLALLSDLEIELAKGVVLVFGGVGGGGAGRNAA